MKLNCVALDSIFFYFRTYQNTTFFRIFFTFGAYSVFIPFSWSKLHILLNMSMLIHTYIHTYVLMHKNISSDIACWRSNHKYYITVAYLHIPSFQRAFIFFDCLTSPWCFLDLQVHSMNYFSALRSFAFNQLTYVHMYMNYYTCIVYVCVCVYLFALCFYFNFIMF